MFSMEFAEHLGFVKSAARQSTVVLDFDGVINPYLKGWQGVGNIPEAPDPLAVRRIKAWRADKIPVVVQSARANSAKGKQAILDYLRKHDIPITRVYAKPHGAIYVDDRGYKHRSWKATGRYVKRQLGMPRS